MKRCFAWLGALILGVGLLSACGKEKDFTVEDLRELYKNAVCAGESEIVACGDYLARYRTAWSGGPAGWSTEILEPASVAGVRAELHGESGTLSYDGAELDALLPEEPGLSPADLLPYCMTLLASREPEAWGEVRLDGVRCILLSYVSERGEAEVEHRIWLEAGALTPCRVEGWYEGQMLLRAGVSDFSRQTPEPVAEKENL